MSSHQPTINEHHFTLQVLVPETEDSQKVIEVLGNLLKLSGYYCVLSPAIFSVKGEDDVVH